MRTTITESCFCGSAITIGGPNLPGDYEPTLRDWRRSHHHRMTWGADRMRQWLSSDGDTRCQECGQPNVVWFAPNEVWNTVMGDEGGILCIPCFVHRAQAAGFGTRGAWRLLPPNGETHPPQQAWIGSAPAKGEPQ